MVEHSWYGGRLFSKSQVDLANWYDEESVQSRTLPNALGSHSRISLLS